MTSERGHLWAATLLDDTSVRLKVLDARLKRSGSSFRIVSPCVDQCGRHWLPSLELL